MKEFNFNTKNNRKARRSKKAEKLELIGKLMKACSEYARVEYQHKFQITRSREEEDRIVVDIPSVEEVDEHLTIVGKLYEQINDLL